MSNSPRSFVFFFARGLPLFCLVFAGCGSNADMGADAAVSHDVRPRAAAARVVVATNIPGLGSQCGVAGGRCCDGNVCESGGCCLGGRCVEPEAPCPAGIPGGPPPGICREGACGGCGGVDQPCCAGSCTAPGTKCQDGLCASCGFLGQFCCRGACLQTATVCSASLSAAVGGGLGGSALGQCVQCGLPGQPCCGGDTCAKGGCCHLRQCVAPGDTCAMEAGQCRNGSCTGCGGPGQACCAGSCRDPAQACGVNQRCEFCGGLDKPCCRGASACGDGLGCLGTGLARVCRPCGDSGGPCCAAGRCNKAAGCCVAGTCVDPGGSCAVPGVADLGVCDQGACSGCGMTGGACCRSALLPRQSSCADPLSLCLTAADQQPTAPPMGLLSQDPARAPQVGMCLGCGMPGAPCCPWNRCLANGCCLRQYGGDLGTCVAETSLCPDGARCGGGSCGTCGGANQRCCRGSTCTAADTTCRVVATLGERCLPCGDAGQPCCFDQRLAPTCKSAAVTCRSGVCLER